VGVRWVDVDKGYEVRSRLVAQEFARKCGDDHILSEVASSPNRKLMILDIERAFLYGYIEDEIYNELPDEDPMKEEGYVGKLTRAMSGTRAAPQVWREVVRKAMSILGFSPSSTCPCVCYNQEKEIRVFTHVDDFLCSGEGHELQWIRKELQKEFELKHDMMVNYQDEAKGANFLGRN
jgi:recombinational DNA repair protein (RecF pathway)